MNKKGFVLMETLVVTVFTMFIFTVLYNSIVPLLGRYNELSYYDNIDITYDAYHVSKLIRYANNSEEILNNHYKVLKCQDIENAKCNSLLNMLNIDVLDEVIILDMNYVSELKNDSNISNIVKEYVDYIDASGIIVLIQNDGYISYIKYRGVPVEPDVSFSVSGDAYSSGYKKGAVVTVTCESNDGITNFDVRETSGSNGTLTVNDDNLKTRTITLNNAGSARQISVSCTTSYDLTTNTSRNYAVYEYSRSSSCSCASYKCSGSACGYNYSSWSSWSSTATNYSSKPSDTTLTQYQCVSMNMFYSCKTRTRTRTAKCCSAAGCETRNYCWHT